MNNLEQQGFNDGAAGKRMAFDPQWSAAEKSRYVGAYMSGKKRLSETQH
jgi:hypothetical protein